MLHELIKTDNYLLVVSDEEIKEDDWYKTPLGIYSQFNGTEKLLEGTKRVSAHLPLNNSPILEGVALLPPIEDEVEKLAVQEVGVDNSIYNISDHESFIKGYNKAKEKYKYTEEDMINAILFGMQKGLNVGKVDETDNDWVNNYVKSLQQPKMPIGFECTMVDFEVDMGLGEECIEYNQYPKTTTNSQGITQWVGTYKYKISNEKTN